MNSARGAEKKKKKKKANAWGETHPNAHLKCHSKPPYDLDLNFVKFATSQRDNEKMSQFI